MSTRKKREQTMGIDYFGVSTSIKDDDKIFDLKYRYATRDGDYDAAAGYTAYGRFIDLLAEIYREGFAMVVTPQARMRIALQLGMGREEFDEFIDTCVDVGLFDNGMWKEHGVLTSRGIQKRYYIVASRRQGSIPEEHRRWLLIDHETDDEDEDEHGAAGSDDDAQDETSESDTLQQPAATLQQDAATLQQPETTCTNERDSMSQPAPQDKEKEKGREVEVKREEEDEGNARAAAEAPIAPVPTTARSRQKRKRKARRKSHEQPYPLACFALNDEETLFDDAAGNSYETPWDALVARLDEKAPLIDPSSFAKCIVETCPADCDESRSCVLRCYELMCKALDRFDPTKCSNPAPLVMKVLEEDRGDAA